MPGPWQARDRPVTGPRQASHEWLGIGAAASMTGPLVRPRHSRHPGHSCTLSVIDSDMGARALVTSLVWRWSDLKTFCCRAAILIRTCLLQRAVWLATGPRSSESPLGWRLCSACIWRAVAIMACSSSLLTTPHVTLEVCCPLMAWCPFIWQNERWHHRAKTVLYILETMDLSTPNRKLKKSVA